MGAWGEDPMANDTALDWMGAQVEAPLAAAIQDTFQGYLEGRRKPAEAEAAAALLVDYTTCPGVMKYRHIDLGPEAAERGLGRLGSEVIRRMMADESWINSWLDPGTKLRVLEELLAELQELEVARK